MAASHEQAVNEVRLWAVEVDGWAWHHQAGRFQRDRTRQNALVNDGWLVLRFTAHNLTARPDQVLANIVGRWSIGQGLWCAAPRNLPACG